MNVPNDKIEEVGKILPVLRSLTCIASGTRRMGAVYTGNRDKDTFWDVIDQLKEAGAEEF
jgi:ATP phosphoribosyltransferase